MRIVLHNPHSNFIIGRTVLDFLLRIYSYKKYSYFLEYLIKENKNFLVYIDGADSSLPKYLSRVFPQKLEVFFWMLLNGINPLKVSVTQNIDSIKDTDIFISFSLRNLDKKNVSIDRISEKHFIKLFHITHYVQNTSLIAKNVKKLNIDYLIAENNLSKNSPYFKKYFSFYKKDVYTLPFVAQKRFRKRNSFNKRINKCLATGTIVDISKTGDPKEFIDFRNFYHTKILQPIRNEIFKNRDDLKNEIDSLIGVLYEKDLKKNTSRNIFKLLIMKIYNALISTRRDYFKFDIVDKYNSYTMFINGEEINDLPGVGFVEGMSCGTAYIGQDNNMYKDLGMKPGVHYITYDGTLKDLKNVITYYQNHSDELKKIADAGYKFAQTHFSEKKVAKKFYNDLLKLSQQYRKNNGNIKLRSSFVSKY